ncbi:MAG: GNAT family N-acetyltransferase [Candidatus Omnitrophota bacterium]
MNNLLVKRISIKRMVHYQKNLLSNIYVDEEANIEQIKSRSDININYFASLPKGLLEEIGAEFNHLIEKDTSCLVAMHNNNRVGCILFNIHGKADFLKPFSCKFNFGPEHVYGFGLFVKPEFRNKKIGKILYFESFKFLKTQFKYFDIFVNSVDFIPNQLAQKLGFYKVNEAVLIKFFIFEFKVSLKRKYSKIIFESLYYLLKIIKEATKLLLKPLKWVLNKIYSINNSLHLKLYIAACKKNDGGARFAFICKSRPDNTILKRITDLDYEITKYKTFRKVDLRNEVNNISENTHLIVIDGKYNYLINKLGYIKGIYFIPQWVRQTNPIFLGINDLVKTNKLRKSETLLSDIKKINNSHYEYEFFKNDRSLLDFFYYNMYTPYVNNRYGDEKFLTSYGEILSYFKKGGLILVKDGDRYVSGTIVKIEDKKLSTCKSGVLNGDMNLVKKGVLTALFYFYCKFAQDNGLTKIDYGLSRPFLNDGVLRYKAKWNTKIDVDKKSSKVFVLKINQLSEFTRNFLINNPFITIEKNILRGNVFYDSNSKENREKYSINGLSEFKMINLDEMVV